MPPRVVLVVDDEVITRDVVAAMLEHEDVEVHTAASGEAAIEVAAAIHPQVVLLDVSMPGMSGLEVCKALRNGSSGGLPRVVMLTGRAEDHVREAALAAGADAYLVKPFSAVDLYRAVEGSAANGH